MADSRHDDFYVGYQKNAPVGLARFLRAAIAGLMVLGTTLAIVLTMAQGKFAQAYFEFGNERSFEGFVSEQPYPTLLVRRPESAGAVPFSRYLLTAPGKIGAQELLLGLDGKRVAFNGTLVYRDDQTMVEVVPNSVRVLADSDLAGNVPVPVSLGRFTLSGEIMDSKCYLGVMKPGEGKPHRACAIRCISGGIPPVFVVRDAAGNTLHLLLTGEDGRSVNKEVLDYVAEPIELDGEIVRDGALLVLRTEPAAFRRAR